MNQPSILFFLEGENVPATRFRTEQFEPVLIEHGVKYKKLYSHPSKYLYYPKLIKSTPFSYPWAAILLLIVVCVRLVQIMRYARGYSVIFLQRDLLYRVRAPILEIFLCWWVKDLHEAGEVRLVFDVDDNILINKSGKFSPSLRSKLSQICGRMDLVICGNDFLAGIFKEFSPKVKVIPTLIDTGRYQQASKVSNSKPVIGWTGLATNLIYLAKIEAVLNELSTSHSFVLRLICEAQAPTPFRDAKFLVEWVPWNRAQEIQDLAQFDIGLMPLPDTDFTRGKCGFKLLQYMALQIPAIASPVGVNSSIIEDGKNGFLAQSDQDWIKGLRLLLDNSELRARVGVEGQKTVAERYSLASWKDRWIKAVVTE